MFDTIAAISTPRGEGGIGIVRLSGDESLGILSKIFKPKSKKDVKDIKSYTINYGHIYDGDELIDEVLVSVMKAPNTYTREDIVEINCHGGYLITQKVLELVLKSGAKIAEPGEFTRRAFLNGRLDLTQAEAVIDLIHGKTDKSISLSLNNLRGDLRDQINHLKKILLDVAAHVNVVLDYPEEGVDEPIPEHLIIELHNVKDTITKLVESYDKGKMIKEGIKTVNKALYDMSLEREEFQGMGCTLVAAVIEDGVLYAANVGDSRLYLIHDGSIRQITRDHSYVEEMVAMGMMQRGSADYNRKKNIITRAAGIRPDIVPDFFEEELERGDYILLCSDGLSNMVDNDTLCSIILSEGSLKEKAQRLIAEANERGGTDNIAVVLVKPEEGGMGSC